MSIPVVRIPKLRMLLPYIPERYHAAIEVIVWSAVAASALALLAIISSE